MLLLSKSHLNQINIIKTIESTTKNGTTDGNDNISDDNVASDDTNSQ